MPFQPSNTWAATYYDGHSSQGVAAQVGLTPAGLTIYRDEAPTVQWQYGEARPEGGSIDGGPVRLSRPGAVTEMLLFADPKVFDEIRKLNPAFRVKGATAPASGLWKALGVLAAATVAVIVVLYKFALPAIGGAMAKQVPVAWEEKLGESVARQTTALEKTCTASEVVEPIRQLTQRLADQRPGNPYKFRVTVAQGDMVNAFAAPGGYVVVYRGLLDKTKSPEELAAVLAHEVTHVLDRHPTTAMMRSISLWALISMLFGDSTGTIISLAGALEELRFSRDQEESADRGAMELMARAKVDPRASVAVFRTLEKEGGDLPAFAKYLSTHPRTADRIRSFEQWAESVTYRAEPVLPGQAWPPQSAACGK
ncbi:MAG: M48 family metallopeptidase [Bryobacteraceae bacterium]